MRFQFSFGAGTALALAAWLAASGLAASAADAPAKPGPILIPPLAQDINGVWWADSYNPRIRPVDGSDLPFTPTAKSTYQKTMAGLKDGSVTDFARTRCVPDGVPRILATPYPFEIFQTPGQVTITYEQNHMVRIITMDQKMPSEDDLAILPYYGGDSYGHWDGDSLIVETAGFNEKTFIDDTGVPHGDQLRTSERIRKIDGGKALEDVVTVSDPKTFTKPWTARFVYKPHPEIRLTDYVCGEKHRDLSSVKGAPQ